MRLQIADGRWQIGTAMAAALLAAIALRAQEALPTSAAQFAELEALAQSELAATRAPGAAIALVKRNRIVYQHGFGIANIETGQAVTPDMLFRIGSVTKMFTTAALVTMADEPPPLRSRSCARLPTTPATGRQASCSRTRPTWRGSRSRS